MSEEDLKEVYRINRDSFTSDAWLLEAFKREFELSYSYKYVLEHAGRVIGYIIFWIIDREATVMTFALSREYRGKGLGKFFFREMMERIRKYADKIILDVRKSNIKAIRLYKDLGFRIVKERKKFYSDGEDAFMMEKELGDGAYKREKTETANR